MIWWSKDTSFFEVSLQAIHLQEKQPAKIIKQIVFFPLPRIFDGKNPSVSCRPLSRSSLRFVAQREPTATSLRRWIL